MTTKTLTRHIWRSSNLLGSQLNQNQPEVDTYISGLSTPLSAAQITRLNTFVSALKTGLSISALSDAFDVMYILAGETAESSLRNLVKRAHDAQTVNSPTFTALEGFTGNGTSSYIDHNYNPATQGITYTLNNASAAYYHRLNLAAGDRPALSNAINIFLFPRFTGDIMAIRLNSSFYTNFANTDARGLYINVWPNATTEILYKNKTANTATRNSSIIGSGNALSLRGTATFSNNQQAIVFFGRSFNQTEVNVITDAIEAYMDSSGKGVIA